MLVQNVYSVYDLKGEAYGLPYYAVNDRVAMRLFLDGCRDPETPVGRHPHDFALFRVGIWNAENGTLAGTDVPVPVWTGVEAMKMKEGN